MTARLFTLNPLEGFRPITFAGHRDAVVGAYFTLDAEAVRLYLFSQNGSTNNHRSIPLVEMVQSLFGKPRLNPPIIILIPKKSRLPHHPPRRKTLVTRSQARDGVFTTDTTLVNLGRRLFVPRFTWRLTFLSLVSPQAYSACGRCLRFLTSIH